MFKFICHGPPFLLADDIKIVYSFEAGSFKSTYALISEDLEPLHKWFSKWFVKFSADMSSLLT